MPINPELETKIIILLNKDGAMRIPARVQTKYARDYCAANNLGFSLPSTESLLAKENFIDQHAQGHKNIIIFSAALLNRDHGHSLRSASNKETRLQEVYFHFTFEDKVMSSEELIDELEMVSRYTSFNRWSQQILANGCSLYKGSDYKVLNSTKV